MTMMIMIMIIVMMTTATTIGNIVTAFLIMSGSGV
jgi:hypothetical protein